MKNLTYKILAVVFSLAAAAAYAGSSSVNYTSSGSSGVRTTTDGTTNCTGATACNLPNNTIWDSVAGANGWQINANHAGLIEGAGVGGAPSGGVLTIQGAGGGTAVNITGTVNPGNTPNSTAWLVTGTGGSFPIPANSSVNINQVTGGTPSAAGNYLWMATAQPASTTMQTAATGNGNGTLLPVTGFGQAFINVNCSVACSGGTTINFEGTDSTGTFFPVAAYPIGGGGGVTTTTTSGQFVVPASALTSLRARISGYSAGTITVTGTTIAEAASIVPTAAAGGTSSSFAATFPATGTAMGAQFNTATPSFASNQMTSLYVGSNGSLRVIDDNSATSNGLLSSINSSLAGPILAQAATAWNTNGPFTSATNNAVMADLRGVLWVDHGAWAGTQLGAPTNFGTTPGAVIAGSVNASVFQGTNAVANEPCQTGTKTPVAIPAISTSVSTLLVTNTGGGKSIYVCHMFLNTSVAEGISVLDGTTGGTCNTGTDVLLGDTTANTTTLGMQLSANQGWSIGGGGYWVLKTAANKDLCLYTGSTGQVRGSLVVVQQ